MDYNVPMVESGELAEVVAEIVERDPRYAKAAYFFTHRAVRHTAEVIGKREKSGKRQISGQELLEGIRQFAIDQFGPLAHTVFLNWNLTKSRDFGEIVFHLAQRGVLSVTEKDRIEDFDDFYQFSEVFSKPFEPKARRFPRVSLDQLEEGAVELVPGPSPTIPRPEEPSPSPRAGS